MATTKRSTKPKTRVKSVPRSTAKASRKAKATIATATRNQRETVGTIIFTLLALAFLAFVMMKYM